MATPTGTGKYHPPDDDKGKDGDEDVLFEGELTWTHDPVEASPELMKRTPRDAEPDESSFGDAPSEGAIEIQDVDEGGGEIFSHNPSKPSRKKIQDISDVPESTEEPIIEDTPESEVVESSSEEDPFAADTMAADPVPDDIGDSGEEAPSQSAPAPKRTTSMVHNKMITPLNGFNKSKVGQPALTSKDTQTAAAVSAGQWAVARRFAPDDDQVPQPSKGSGKTILLSIVIVVVLMIIVSIVGLMIFSPGTIKGVLGFAGGHAAASSAFHAGVSITRNAADVAHS